MHVDGLVSEINHLVGYCSIIVKQTVFAFMLNCSLIKVCITMLSQWVSVTHGNVHLRMNQGTMVTQEGSANGIPLFD